MTIPWGDISTAWHSTKAEHDVPERRNLLGQVRLSCQALCDHDMKVRVLMTVSSTGLDGPGRGVLIYARLAGKASVVLARRA